MSASVSLLAFLFTDLVGSTELLARLGEDAAEVLRRTYFALLREAIALAGLFIDQGPVVQVKEPNARVRRLDDPEKGVVYGGPLMVLVNRSSAPRHHAATHAAAATHRRASRQAPRQRPYCSYR